MREQIESYIASLYQDIPNGIYEGAISVYFFGAVTIVFIKGWKRGWRKLVALLLVEYVFLVYCSTVLFRATIERGYNFRPFWSYDKTELVIENVMNIVVFIPIGALLGSLLRVKGSWLIALMVGMVISISIEAMQFFFHKGFAETDDVMHNTLGCILGYMLVKGSRLMVMSFI